MLQSARSSNSKSFLREIEDAIVLVENQKDKSYFLDKMTEVFTKRKDPNTLFTGEKSLKAELLVYLKALGQLRTANVWARNIPMQRSAIDECLALLQERLKAEGIQGILELHLQDREINSPHFQFVGIKSEMAESIIAHTLVELGYEISVESALSKKDFVPYYEENSKARVQDLNTLLEYYEKKRLDKETRQEEEFENEFALIAKQTKELLEQFKAKRTRLSQRVSTLQTNLSEYKAHLQSKDYHLKRIRKRLRRR